MRNALRKKSTYCKFCLKKTSLIQDANSNAATKIRWEDNS